MTDAQAGGIKGRATVDHIMILKELVSIANVITYNTVSRTITGQARDALIELIMNRNANKNQFKS